MYCLQLSWDWGEYKTALENGFVSNSFVLGVRPKSENGNVLTIREYFNFLYSKEIKL